MADNARDRNIRLAQALKQNLKRRKAGSAAGTGLGDASPLPDRAGPEAGDGRQKGLMPSPEVSPKTASKRN